MRSEILSAERYGSSFETYQSPKLLNFVTHGEVFAPITLSLDYFAKTKFLQTISKCRVKYFEQSAMDLCLELLKAQHS